MTRHGGPFHHPQWWNGPPSCTREPGRARLPGPRFSRPGRGDLLKTWFDPPNVPGELFVVLGRDHRRRGAMESWKQTLADMAGDRLMSLKRQAFLLCGDDGRPGDTVAELGIPSPN
jgi:hypothetical protein